MMFSFQGSVNAMGAGQSTSAGPPSLRPLRPLNRRHPRTRCLSHQLKTMYLFSLSRSTCAQRLLRHPTCHLRLIYSPPSTHGPAPLWLILFGGFLIVQPLSLASLGKFCPCHVHRQGLIAVSDPGVSCSSSQQYSRRNKPWNSVPEAHRRNRDGAFSHHHPNFHPRK